LEGRKIEGVGGLKRMREMEEFSLKFMARTGCICSIKDRG
jgi:hypothetical protein